MVCISTSAVCKVSRVTISIFCCSRIALETIPTGVFLSRCWRMIFWAFSSCQYLFLLLGLYNTMTKSALAAASRRFSISSQGVSRSLRLMAAKSWVSGAPNRAAPALRAGIPGTTSILRTSLLSAVLLFGHGGTIAMPLILQVSKTRPAMA